MIIFVGLGLNVPANSDYLIVLGARIRGETPSLALQYHLDVAYDYLEQNSSTRAILIVGKGAGGSIKEAGSMKRYLVDKGISSERLVLESQVTNTMQNLSYSFKLIDAATESLQVVVVIIS